jgi:PiT family inorganic phosphate transporter
MEIFFIILALLIGLYMLWNIGANDVANAVGTSIGSGAITLKKAILIAAVLEFAGALILGANVSETIQSGIVDPKHFIENPDVFVIGMLASLLATALWLQVATFFKWPVSGTHAIIGAVLGFGLIVAGINAVQWPVVGRIALSWVISPAISAFVSYLFFYFIQRKILYAYSPLLATKKIVPWLVFIVFMTFIISTGANGVGDLKIQLSLTLVISIALLVGLIAALITRILCERIHDDAKINPMIAAKQEQQMYSLNKVHKHLIRAKLSSGGKVSSEISDILLKISSIIHDVKDKTKWESHLSSDYQSVERIFAGLQIISACFVAFAHGANDVANAIGPVSAVLNVIRDPKSISTITQVPLWLLGFGGAGIVFGLATYGWRVIDTIGTKITQLTPTRGFAAEFGAASTILVASKLGMPISTTHAIVGAVLGVGLARGLSALNFRMIKGIFLSWIITIPAAAAMSVLIFYLFRFLFNI